MRIDSRIDILKGKCVCGDGVATHRGEGMAKVDLTIVVPVYNEEPVVEIFYRTIEEMRDQIGAEGRAPVSLEYLFVDDGSKDGTLSKLQTLAAKDSEVHYLSFSRNFGKEAAIYAGLSHAKGKYTAIMDVDLQDPPELLPEMYALLTSGEVDIVCSRRVSRKGEPKIRSFFARRFYAMMSRMSAVELADGARDYQMMNRKVKEAILSVGEYNRFYKGISGWVGFRRKWLEFENRERAAGETKWSFGKLFLYALEGIYSFSTTPLVVSSVVGSVFCGVSFFLIIFIIIKTLVFGDPTSGWPSMVCLIMMVSGVQLLCIGILGQYLAKTYMETKRRPLYLIREKKTGGKKRSVMLYQQRYRLCQEKRNQKHPCQKTPLLRNRKVRSDGCGEIPGDRKNDPVMHEKKLVGEAGSIEKKGPQRLELQYERRDPVQEDKEENPGKGGGLHRKVHRERKQKEKRRDPERQDSDPFSFLQAVAESEI